MLPPLLSAVFCYVVLIGGDQYSINDEWWLAIHGQSLFPCLPPCLSHSFDCLRHHVHTMESALWRILSLSSSAITGDKWCITVMNVNASTGFRSLSLSVSLLLIRNCSQSQCLHHSHKKKGTLCVDSFSACMMNMMINAIRLSNEKIPRRSATTGVCWSVKSHHHHHKWTVQNWSSHLLTPSSEIQDTITLYSSGQCIPRASCIDCFIIFVVLFLSSITFWLIIIIREGVSMCWHFSWNKGS